MSLKELTLVLQEAGLSLLLIGFWSWEEAKQIVWEVAYERQVLFTCADTDPEKYFSFGLLCLERDKIYTGNARFWTRELRRIKHLMYKAVFSNCFPFYYSLIYRARWLWEQKKLYIVLFCHQLNANFTVHKLILLVTWQNSYCCLFLTLFWQFFWLAPNFSTRWGVVSFVFISQAPETTESPQEKVFATSFLVFYFLTYSERGSNDSGSTGKSLVACVNCWQ